MHLIEDTRQQKGKHELKHNYWRKLGVNVVRSALPFGDYAFVPLVVVDTKQSIYEIANNIQQDHDRFRQECINAHNAGCQLVILVENVDGVDSLKALEHWQESAEHYAMRRGKRRISGKRLAATMATMTERYGVIFEFCTPNQAAKRILEILEAWK